MEKSVSHVLKIGDQEYMDLLLNIGELFFDTVESFNKKDANSERYDSHEGAIEIEQITWLKLQLETGATLELSRDSQQNKLSSAFILTHEDSIKGNIFCCTCITPDTKENFKNLDIRFQSFGDTIILINNPNLFFKRIEDELKRRKIDYKIRYVTYYNPTEYRGELTIFHKKDLHSYQNEIRIWVDNESGEPFKLHIGSISDIAQKFKMKDIIGLEVYEV